MKHTVHVEELPKGARALLINIPGSQVVSQLITFRAGNLFADRAQSELPHVMEHLAFGANKNIDNMLEVAAALERNGAMSNAFTSDYLIGYEAESADFEAERITKLLSDNIARPLFKSEELQAEIGNVREELNGFLGDYGRMTWHRLGSTMSGQPTYQDGLNCLVDLDTDAVRDHHQKTHHPANMHILLAGNLGPAMRGKLLKLYRQLIEDLPNDTARLELPEVSLTGMDTPIIHTEQIPQIHYAFTQGNKATDELTSEANAIAAVMAGGRFKSWIMGEARRRGLAYGFGMRTSSMPDYSMLRFGSFVTPENAPELFGLVRDGLKRLKAGDLDKTEIDEARAIIAGQRILRYDTPMSMLSWYLDDFALRDRVYDFQQSLEVVNSVSAVKIRRAAQDMLSEPNWGLSMTGAITPELASELYETIDQVWN